MNHLPALDDLCPPVRARAIDPLRRELNSADRCLVRVSDWRRRVRRFGLLRRGRGVGRLDTVRQQMLRVVMPDLAKIRVIDQIDRLRAGLAHLLFVRVLLALRRAVVLRARHRLDLRLVEVAYLKRAGAIQALDARANRHHILAVEPILLVERGLDAASLHGALARREAIDRIGLAGSHLDLLLGFDFSVAALELGARGVILDLAVCRRPGLLLRIEQRIAEAVPLARLALRLVLRRLDAPHCLALAADIDRRRVDADAVMHELGGLLGLLRALLFGIGLALE